jgi:hypothetical protein
MAADSAAGAACGGCWLMLVQPVMAAEMVAAEMVVAQLVGCCP